jgi:hypothetical protein
MTSETSTSVDSLQKQLDKLQAKARLLGRTSVASATVAMIALGLALHSPNNIECDSLRVNTVSTNYLRIVDSETWRQPTLPPPLEDLGVALRASKVGKLIIGCEQVDIRQGIWSSHGISFNVGSSKPRLDLMDSDRRPTVQIVGGTDPSIDLVLGDPEQRRTVIDGDSLVIKRGSGDQLALWRSKGPRINKGNYKNFKKEGPWTVWNKDRSINSEKSGIYKAGKKVAPLPDK